MKILELAAVGIGGFLLYKHFSKTAAASVAPASQQQAVTSPALPLKVAQMPLVTVGANITPQPSFAKLKLPSMLPIVSIRVPTAPTSNLMVSHIQPTLGALTRPSPVTAATGWGFANLFQTRTAQSNYRRAVGT